MQVARFRSTARAQAAFATALAAVTTLMTVPAHAAIDAAVSTAFTGVKDDAIALSAIVVPIVVSVLGLMLVIKLIKRFGNKI